VVSAGMVVVWVLLVLVRVVVLEITDIVREVLKG
jgi:hypothetical protein